MSVPNTELTTTTVTNVDGMERHRHSVAFAVGYDDDLTAAQRIVREAPADHERISERPSPEVNISDLADSYVEVEALVWTAATAPAGTILSEFRKAVKTRFDTANIEMPSPTGSLQATSKSRTAMATPSKRRNRRQWTINSPEPRTTCTEPHDRWSNE